MKKILVVEDERALREALVHSLSKEMYTILEAKNGEECLEVLKNQDVDLILLDVVVRPVGSDNITLAFGGATQILAHDGLGTNVLRKKVSASYQARENDDENALILFSSSHPNSTRWYNTSVAQFSWRGTAYTTYAYTFNERLLAAMPEDAPETESRTLSIPLDTDGVFYFHIQPVVDGVLEGEMLVYKIQSDQTPPSDPLVRVSADSVDPGEIIRIEFESKDATSGIETPYYYVSYNDDTFFPVQSPLYTALPEVDAGTITIRAYDNAGNLAQTRVEINVSSKQNNFVTEQAAQLVGAFKTIVDSVR